MLNLSRTAHTLEITNESQEVRFKQSIAAFEYLDAAFQGTYQLLPLLRIDFELQ
jgi:hypothetical protein